MKLCFTDGYTIKKVKNSQNSQDIYWNNLIGLKN